MGGTYFSAGHDGVYICVYKREKWAQGNVLPSKGSKSPGEVIRLKLVYSDNLYRFCA